MLNSICFKKGKEIITDLWHEICVYIYKTKIKVNGSGNRNEKVENFILDIALQDSVSNRHWSFVFFTDLLIKTKTKSVRRVHNKRIKKIINK